MVFCNRNKVRTSRFSLRTTLEKRFLELFVQLSTSTLNHDSHIWNQILPFFMDKLVFEMDQLEMFKIKPVVVIHVHLSLKTGLIIVCPYRCTDNLKVSCFCCLETVMFKLLFILMLNFVSSLQSTLRPMLWNRRKAMQALLFILFYNLCK